jgi:hypothetical protein
MQGHAAAAAAAAAAPVCAAARSLTALQPGARGQSAQLHRNSGSPQPGSASCAGVMPGGGATPLPPPLLLPLLSAPPGLKVS